MKCLKRNKRQFYYCTIQRDEHGQAVTREIVDEYGNLTGQYIVLYNEPVSFEANISPATGQSNTEQFGNLENYDKVIVIDDLNCPIDESSVLFIDKALEYGDNVIIGYKESATVLGDPTPIIYKPPLFDYNVARVAKSLNSVSIAARKAEVS